MPRENLVAGSVIFTPPDHPVSLDCPERRDDLDCAPFRALALPVLESAPTSSAGDYGVYQIGEVYARSWIEVGASGGGTVPKNLAS